MSVAKLIRFMQLSRGDQGIGPWQRGGNPERTAGPCVGGHHAGHLYPHHRRHAAHSRRQHRPKYWQSSAAGRDFRVGVGNYPGHGGKAENDRLQALCRPQAQIRHWLRHRDQRPSLEGRYSPKWPDGKKHARNVYAHTREECEEKLKVLIKEMKAEIAEAKRLMDEGKGDGSPLEEKSKQGK